MSASPHFLRHTTDQWKRDAGGAPLPRLAGQEMPACVGPCGVTPPSQALASQGAEVDGGTRNPIY